MTSLFTPMRFLDEGTSLPAALPAEVLDAPVAGTRLAPQATFRAQLGPQPDALVFLRHFG